MNFHSNDINELITALSKAQGEMSAAAKDSNNPFFGSKYADLSSVWNACRDALSQHGLAVIQTMNKADDGEMYLATTLGHASGQWMRSYLPIKIKVPENAETDKWGKPKKVNELQLLGSCLTYLRRYALAAIVGVAPDEDDDGNSAMGYQAPKKYEKAKKEEPISLPYEEEFTQEDFKPEEVNAYLEKNWHHDLENFKLFMAETMAVKKWNYRTCINIFDTHKEHTTKTFIAWLAKNSKA